MVMCSTQEILTAFKMTVSRNGYILNRMSIHKLKSGYTSGTIAWVLPHPIIGTLSVSPNALTYTFALRNTGDVAVTIHAVDLNPGHDNRIRVSGGTCRRGVTLAPRSSSTIVLEVIPHTPGAVKQQLRIQHNGFGPPIVVDIAFTINGLLGKKRSSAGSYLVDETRMMDRQRRLQEQDGHRRLAKVHARHHADEEQSQQPAPEGEMQNNILQNPWLDSQRFDGVDPNLNPEPPLNTDARREFDNERREQEMEKQLRLGNMPKFNTAPKPRPS